jgi:hypothetical protein
MKIVAALLALALTAAPLADPILGSGHGLDHVMLWTSDPDAATTALRDRLGFDVRPGGAFGDGIVNRLVRFPDGSYLELLSLSRPRDQLRGDAADAAGFLDRGPGADTFALETSDMDAAASAWRSRGLDVFPEEPAVYDPDGPGPLPPRAGRFRTLFLREKALRSADLFLVSYARPPGAVGSPPNGALGLTAVLLVTPDLAADARRLVGMGLRRERSIALPRLGGRGLVFAAGRGHVLLVAPSGPGRAAEALRRNPRRIFAIDIAVADLETAHSLVEKGYRRPVVEYEGPWGKAFDAPSQADLGVAIQFHAARPPA